MKQEYILKIVVDSEISSEIDSTESLRELLEEVLGVCGAEIIEIEEV